MAELKHIIRVANVDIPGNKAIVVSLTKIKGIGKNLAHVICNQTKIQTHTKTGALNDSQVTSINDFVKDLNNKLPKWFLNHRKDNDSGEDKHHLTGTLDFVKDNDIKKMRKIKSYKGVRHSKKLPVRGQRTKSNFRRNKGKVASLKKNK